MSRIPRLHDSKSYECLAFGTCTNPKARMSRTSHLHDSENNESLAFRAGTTPKATNVSHIAPAPTRKTTKVSHFARARARTTPCTSPKPNGCYVWASQYKCIIATPLKKGFATPLKKNWTPQIDPATKQGPRESPLNSPPICQGPADARGPLDAALVLENILHEERVQQSIAGEGLDFTAAGPILARTRDFFLEISVKEQAFLESLSQERNT